LLFLQALALEFGERADASHDGSQVAADNNSNNNYSDSTFYEITIATVDQPKLLSRLSDAMVSMWCKPQCAAAQEGAVRAAVAVAAGALATAWDGLMHIAVPACAAVRKQQRVEFHVVCLTSILAVNTCIAQQAHLDCSTAYSGCHRCILAEAFLQNACNSTSCSLSHPLLRWSCCCCRQGDLGLNIREAHVFNTTDGFALDVFVVDGWSSEVR
jgi:hypothetical protein